MKVKWTNEMLRKEALKYNKKISFQKGSSAAYQYAHRIGLFEEICSHMSANIKWSDDMLKDEALKYHTRIGFQKGSISAYLIAYKRGVLDEICSHMVRVGNIHNRFIYTIEFENNNIYIGLTSNLERRKYEHINGSSNKHVNELINNGINFTFNSDNILYSSNEASKIEISLVSEYKEKGYNILNISKPGGLGGCKTKWTYDMLKDEALKYNTRKSFMKGSSKSYSTAQARGLLDMICSHMIVYKIQWTYDMLKDEALKYDTRIDFIEGSSSAYSYACTKGILNEICSHMSGNIKWSDDMLREEALKYNNRSDFRKCSKAYAVAQKRGLLEHICNHMKK